jgi:hypothetical protein
MYVGEAWLLLPFPSEMALICVKNAIVFAPKKCQKYLQNHNIDRRANFGRFSIALCNEEGRTDWSVNCFTPKAKKLVAEM